MRDSLSPMSEVVFIRNEKGCEDLLCEDGKSTIACGQLDMVTDSGSNSSTCRINTVCLI